MNIPSPAAAVVVENVRKLTSNNSLIADLRAALAGGLNGIEMVPDILAEAMETGAWMARADQNGRRFEYAADRFCDFVADPPPNGLGTTADMICRILGEDHPAIRAEFEGLLAEGIRSPGNFTPDRPRTEAGTFKVHIPDNIRDMEPERPRDRSQEPAAGTSVGYAIRRLGRQRPDLLERVKAGEMSPHGAMVAAGFVEKAITIPATPNGAARRLAIHFKGETLEALIRALETYRD